MDNGTDQFTMKTNEIDRLATTRTERDSRVQKESPPYSLSLSLPPQLFYSKSIPNMTLTCRFLFLFSATRKRVYPAILSPPPGKIPPPRKRSPSSLNVFFCWCNARDGTSVIDTCSYRTTNIVSGFCKQLVTFRGLLVLYFD